MEPFEVHQWFGLCEIRINVRSVAKTRKWSARNRILTGIHQTDVSMKITMQKNIERDGYCGTVNERCHPQFLFRHHRNSASSSRELNFGKHGVKSPTGLDRPSRNGTKNKQKQNRKHRRLIGAVATNKDTTLHAMCPHTWHPTLYAKCPHDTQRFLQSVSMNDT